MRFSAGGVWIECTLPFSAGKLLLDQYCDQQQAKSQHEFGNDRHDILLISRTRRILHREHCRRVMAG